MTGLSATDLSPEVYGELFEAVDAGFCVIEMIFDGDRAVDYRFLKTNRAFQHQTGLVDAVGKTARELVPQLEQHWFDLYGRVATTGEATRFDNGSDAMGRWFEVHALRVGKAADRMVGIIFSDMTARRRSEQSMRESDERLQEALTAGSGIGTWDWDVPNDRV